MYTKYYPSPSKNLKRVIHSKKKNNYIFKFKKKRDFLSTLIPFGSFSNIFLGYLIENFDFYYLQTFFLFNQTI